MRRRFLSGLIMVALVAPAASARPVLHLDADDRRAPVSLMR